jgi:hypothetical protein
VPSARRCVYSVTGVKDADRGILVATLTCKREQWPPNVGVSILQESCGDERILRQGVATVDRLVSRGIFELELIADGEELLAIDLNPRAFGFINLDIALGADLPWLWFESTLHAVSPIARRAPDTPVECRFVLPYYIARSVGWLRGGGPVGASPRTPGPTRRWISMLGDRSDPLPMIASHLRLLRHPGGLVRPYLAKTTNGTGAEPLDR